jgi:mannose-6-phosphate isomerase-like protein (cupin superfamily)
LWLIKIWFSASTFVVIIATFAKPVTVSGHCNLTSNNEIKSINISAKFSLFDKLWTPHIIGELNGQYVKLCKIKNDFVWHSHEHEDELFMVFKGTLLMDFRDGRTVEVKEGEILIVPKGVEHRPHTNGEIVFNLLFEPKQTLHSGTVESEMTVKELGWI